MGNQTITAGGRRMKPDCPLIGQNGNIFVLMGVASQTFRENGLGDEAKEMCERIQNSDSYYEALGIIGEYVNITSMDEQECGSAPNKGMKMY